MAAIAAMTGWMGNGVTGAPVKRIFFRCFWSKKAVVPGFARYCREFDF
jgi:hypothetical protein